MVTRAATVSRAVTIIRAATVRERFFTDGGNRFLTLDIAARHQGQAGAALLVLCGRREALPYGRGSAGGVALFVGRFETMWWQTP